MSPIAILCAIEVNSIIGFVILVAKKNIIASPNKPDIALIIINIINKLLDSATILSIPILILIYHGVNVLPTLNGIKIDKVSLLILE